MKDRVRTETGEIIAVFPKAGFTIIRTLDKVPVEYYGHFSNYVVEDEREIQKGLIVQFHPYYGKGKRPKALLIEIVRAALQGAA